MHVCEHCDNPGEDYIGNFCKVNVIARYPDHYNTTLNFYNFTENGLIPELKKKEKKRYHQGSKNKYTTRVGKWSEEKLWKQSRSKTRTQFVFPTSSNLSNVIYPPLIRDIME